MILLVILIITWTQNKMFQNSGDWPVVDPLPSYGRGRELPGKRHQSLIYGHNITDVILTGS